MGHEIVVDFPPTQMEIAISVSVARQTATTLLARLREQNIIHYNRRYFIFRDMDNLDFADFETRKQN